MKNIIKKSPRYNSIAKIAPEANLEESLVTTLNTYFETYKKPRLIDISDRIGSHHHS